MIEIPSGVVRSFSRFLTPVGQLPRVNQPSNEWNILQDYYLFQGFKTASGTATAIGKKISLPTASSVRIHAGVFTVSESQMRAFVRDLGYEHMDKVNQQQYPTLVFAEGVYPQLVPVLATISQTGQKHVLYEYFQLSGKYVYYIWLHPVETTVVEIVPVAYDEPEKALSRSHLQVAGQVTFGTWSLASGGLGPMTPLFEHYESHWFDTNTEFRYYLTADNMYGTNLETEVSAQPDVARLTIAELGGKNIYARCMRYYVKSHVYALYTWNERYPDVPPALESRVMTGAVFFPLRSFASALVLYDFLAPIRPVPMVSHQLTQPYTGTFDTYVTFVTTQSAVGRHIQMDVSFPNGFVAIDTSPLRDVTNQYVELATVYPTSQTIDYTYKDIDAIQQQYPNANYRFWRIKHFLRDFFAFPEYYQDQQLISIFPSTTLTYYRPPQLNVFLYDYDVLRANFTVSVVLPNGTKQTLWNAQA